MHHPDAHAAIQKQVVEKCHKSDKPDYSVLNEDAARGYRCIISAVDSVDQSHHLGEGWAQTRREVVPIVNSMENCRDEE